MSPGVMAHSRATMSRYVMTVLEARKKTKDGYRQGKTATVEVGKPLIIYPYQAPLLRQKAQKIRSKKQPDYRLLQHPPEQNINRTTGHQPDYKISEWELSQKRKRITSTTRLETSARVIHAFLLPIVELVCNIIVFKKIIASLRVLRLVVG